MQIAIAWFLSAALLVVGCSSKKRTETVDADVASGGCVTDLSKGPDTALPLTQGEKAVGMVCPAGDQDFYAIQVSEGMNLLDVNLAYPSALSKVALQVRLYEVDGVTQVPNAMASDSNASDGKSAVVTTFAVPKPGAYILRVDDASGMAADKVNSYVMQVSAAADPDTHEPNDTAAQAKPADPKPGFFSSVGDVDVYSVTLGPDNRVLQMTVTNPATAKSTIEYEIADSSGKVLGTGKVPPSAKPVDLSQPAPATGTLFVSFHYAAGSAPDRRPEAGYTVVLGGAAETDANEIPTRNDTPAAATCLAGAGSPCAATFASSAVSFKTQSGNIGSRGDRDLFFFRATAAPAVVEATLHVPATSMKMAVDILVPDLASPCKADADCAVLAGSCKTNDDCELSHQCVQATAGSCATATCRQCVGANLCLALPDSPGKSVCGATIYSMRVADGTKTGSDGTNVLRTAQPVFNPGPVYVVVHDSQGVEFDPAATYNLDVRVSPEPDPLDNSTDPASRNNYYNPYPIQRTDLSPNKARAKDISAQIKAGTSVSGYISYQSDEDWFWFTHPCQGKDCGLVFEWVQPGPSSVRPVFLLRRGDDLGLHESWTYTGAMPTTAPVTDVFGDGDCTECSFASAKHGADGVNDAGVVPPAAAYKYYLQVRDVGADDWDFAASGRYEFRLKTVTPGCPASCSEGPDPKVCGCFCKAQNTCPPGPDL
ncbi:MAG TPA: hypothetical protein VF518_03115 [Polyangia bacterium]